MALQLKATRRAPNIPQINDDPRSHTLALRAISEILEIGGRRTKDLNASFVTVQDLLSLGLIDLQGNTGAFVGTDLSEIANIGDLTGAAEGDFLRLRSGVWQNDTLHNADISSGMVLQHLQGASFLTGADETASFAGARQLFGGTGLDLILATPGQATLNLDAATIASLLLADSATQPGDNVSTLTNDAGYLVASDLATVAFTGDYGDLTGVPSTFPPDLTGIDTDDIPEGSNLYFTNERVDDRVAALLVAGTNITLTYNDVGNTLTIDASGGGGSLANPTGLIGLTAVNGVALTGTRSDSTHALDQGIAPTWTAAHTFTRTYTLINDAAIVVDASVPAITIREAGAAANAKWWRIFAAGGQFTLDTENDSAGGNRTALAFARSGSALTSMTYGNPTNLPTQDFYGAVTFNVANGSSGLDMYRQISAPGGGVGRVSGYGQNASSAKTAYGFHQFSISVNTAGAEDGSFLLYTKNAGTDRQMFGVSRTTMLYGNSTDNPQHDFSGDVRASRALASSGGIVTYGANHIAIDSVGSGEGRLMMFGSGTSTPGILNIDMLSSNASVYNRVGRILGDGRVTFPLIHNNAGGTTGTTPAVQSGTYTPTLTNVANAGSLSAGVFQWLRVGNVVTVSGTVNVTPSSAAGTSTSIGISLPIASALTTADQCCGVGAVGTTLPQAGAIRADATNDRASFVYAAQNLTAQVFAVTFTYVVV